MLNIAANFGYFHVKKQILNSKKATEAGNTVAKIAGNSLKVMTPPLNSLFKPKDSKMISREVVQKLASAGAVKKPISNANAAINVMKKAKPPASIREQISNGTFKIPPEVPKQLEKQMEEGLKIVEPYAKMAYGTCVSELGGVVGSTVGTAVAGPAAAPVGRKLGEFAGNVLGFGSADTLFNVLKKEPVKPDPKPFLKQAVGMSAIKIADKVGKVLGAKGTLADEVGAVVGFGSTGIVDVLEHKKPNITAEGYLKTAYSIGMDKLFSAVGKTIGGETGAQMSGPLATFFDMATSDKTFAEAEKHLNPITGRFGKSSQKFKEKIQRAVAIHEK